MQKLKAELVVDYLITSVPLTRRPNRFICLCWEDGAKDGRERNGDVGMRALETAIKWRGVSW